MDIGFKFGVVVDPFSVRARKLQTLLQQLFLQWICMYLHIRKTLIFIIFMIFVDTCFGIEILILWLSISAQIWNPFCVVSMLFLDFVLCFWLDAFFYILQDF